MASIAEQLAALSVVDTLKHAAIPSEGEWAKLAWAASRGSDSEAGWKPPGYSKHEPDGSQGGWYLVGTELTGGKAAVALQRGGSFGFLGEPEFRQFSVWMFTTGASTANGYQLTAKQQNTTDKFLFRLAKYVGGAQTLLGESGEVTMGVDGSFAIVALAGKVSAWVKETAASAWVMVVGEIADATFTKGFSGVDGNGSNPTLINFATGLLVEAEPPEPPKITVVRGDPESGRLAFYLRRPDGTQKRVAGDEVEAENVAQGFTFGTTDPGGFGSFSVSLTRDPRVDYGDYEIYDEFVALGPGNETAYEGYNLEAPKGGDMQAGIIGAGWQNYLKDNPTFQEIYIDRDLGRFGGMSSARKINVIGAAYAPYDPVSTVDPTNGLPALDMGWEGKWPASWGQLVEAWYDAGPSAKIDRLYFTQKALGDVASNLGVFRIYVGACDSADGGGAEFQGNYLGAAEQAQQFGPVVKRRYLVMQFYAPIGAAAGVEGIPYHLLFKSIIAIGTHGLPLATLNPAGILGSDIVADIVKRAAPLLNFTTGPEGSIRPSTYSIPHAIYPEPVTAEDAILQASKYDVPNWGVYDDRTFFWRPPDSGRLWIARQSDPGCELKPAGKQAEDVYTGILVQFTDPAGKQFMVGPPGTSGCDYTDASLQDLSESNPLIERGRKRLGKLVVSATTTLAGAIQLGARWLQEELAVADRGTALVTGFVQDSSGSYEPVWKVRAGDRIRFDDADGRERRIIETSYSHEDRTNSLTLDSTPHRLEALMEKMQVELVAIGGGS